MYIVTALVMLLRGGADAVMMRAQQATSVGVHHGFLSSSQFQQIFSAHGTIMIFFVAMGLVAAFFNFIIPLQIGAREVAFPFVNALSFWFFAAGAMLFVISEEIIPETHSEGRSRYATFALMAGFIIMMILDNMLG